ncbi:MAG: hypothetical protein WB611_09120 [Stellaceae bacterium]
MRSILSHWPSDHDRHTLLAGFGFAIAFGLSISSATASTITLSGTWEDEDIPGSVSISHDAPQFAFTLNPADPYTGLIENYYTFDVTNVSYSFGATSVSYIVPTLLGTPTLVSGFPNILGSYVTTRSYPGSTQVASFIQQNILVA